MFEAITWHEERSFLLRGGALKKLSLLAAIALLSCVRSPDSHRAQVEDDRSIVFPEFFKGGASGERQSYLLDGVTLKALVIASQDFFPPDSRELLCWEKLEGHDYRIIRQADVVFVYLYVSPTRCAREFLAFDSGAKYAISTDGRILRRIFESVPEGPPEPLSPDAGVGSPSREPGFSSITLTPGDEPSRYLPSTWLDGGTGLDGDR